LKNNKKDKITSLSIGGFDGMHLAHKQIFNKLDKNSALIIIQTKYQNLTPQKDRKNYTDFKCFYYNLEDIKHLDGGMFIKKTLKQFKNLKTIIVGFDFKFGQNAKYKANDLKKFFSGDIEIINEFSIDNMPIHSKNIREYLLNGDIAKANKMLGREYCLKGKVIKGLGLGEKEFVPTINIYCSKFLIPKHGVWISRSKIKNQNRSSKECNYKNKYYYSITFIGHKASIDGAFAIETHILNYDKINKQELALSISNPKRLKINFIKFIRKNKKFNSYKELKVQINLDILKAKEYFKI
jgi:riboflavin kinase/FMN adenylyltransferase